MTTLCLVEDFFLLEFCRKNVCKSLTWYIHSCKKNILLPPLSKFKIMFVFF